MNHRSEAPTACQTISKATQLVTRFHRAAMLSGTRAAMLSGTPAAMLSGTRAARGDRWPARTDRSSAALP